MSAAYKPSLIGLLNLDSEWDAWISRRFMTKETLSALDEMTGAFLEQVKYSIVQPGFEMSFS